MNYNQPLVSIASSLLGVLVGATIQYTFNLRANKRSWDLKARSDLYTQLFSQIRNAGNDAIVISSLLCHAQIYASDEVLDILEEVELGDEIPPKLMYDLLVQIRKELRPKSRKRKLRITVHDRESAPNQSSKRTR